MLDVTRLSYAYPDTDEPALREISFTLAAGEVLLLAGANGSGKSTLCYALAGFVPHFFNGEIEGEVTLDSRSTRSTALGEWVQRVGLVLQNPFNQISGARVTVFGEVAFGLENLGVPREEMGPRVTAVLDQLQIAHLADRSPYALSGGQMQRVAIASILVLRPRLLVLDEPTAQLDPASTEELFELLAGLAGEGTTIVLASHKLAEAAPLATRAMVLHRGQVALDGGVAEVLGDPRLPGWGVEPPVYAALAARVGLAPPHPTSFEGAVARFRAGLVGETPPAERGTAPARPELPGVAPLADPLAVRIDEVHFRYPSGVEALRGVEMALEPGRVTALIGANGAGKSTLSRALNGMVRPHMGAIHVGDWRVADHPTSGMARRVGYLFQNPDDQLFKSEVAAEVAFGPRQMGWDEGAREAAVERALALAGLSHARDAHPYDLHPSQRRWVALASVLALRAPVLILDEPTSGMDGDGQARMAALLAALKGAGYTLLLVSHDMQFVADNADWLYVMAEGRVLAGGTPGEIFGQAALLETADVSAAPVARLAAALGLGAGIVGAEGFVRAFRARGGGEGSD